MVLRFSSVDKRGVVVFLSVIYIQPLVFVSVRTSLSDLCFLSPKNEVKQRRLHHLSSLTTIFLLRKSETLVQFNLQVVLM